MIVFEPRELLFDLIGLLFELSPFFAAELLTRVIHLFIEFGEAFTHRFEGVHRLLDLAGPNEVFKAVEFGDGRPFEERLEEYLHRYVDRALSARMQRAGAMGKSMRERRRSSGRGEKGKGVRRNIAREQRVPRRPRARQVLWTLGGGDEGRGLGGRRGGGDESHAAANAATPNSKKRSLSLSVGLGLSVSLSSPDVSFGPIGAAPRLHRSMWSERG